MDGITVMKFHEHFELAQDSKGRSLEAEFSRDGTRVKRILNTRCEFDQFYIRISSESFPYQLEGEQLEALRKVCLEAYRSEELNFLIDVNATNQWLRTVIGHGDLHPTTWTEANSELISKIVIISNIVPYDPYWSKPLARRDGTNVTRVHFPSCILGEALDEKKTLATKLREWMCSEEECEIGLHRREQLRAPKLFWEIQENEVDLVKELGEDVWLIKWNGGRFVQKEITHAEFDFVQRLSHPHIVYSFGELCGGTERPAYFMEFMSNDLKSFILDRKVRVVGEDKPPFSTHDAVHILLQIAKAMEYMHEDVNVVHCDLKSMNVLISEITVSDSMKHYLAKVADFGSARSGNSSSEPTGFIAGPGTTPYMAPEALQQQQQLKDGLKDNKTAYISYPHKIDVYSFGIVAFEVLTGDTKYFYQRSPSTFKKGVIGGTTRPLLREEFIHDKELILLIESCWHRDPSKRPSFMRICEELCKARGRLSEVTWKISHMEYLSSFVMRLCDRLN
jgi:serine/threonine protein kinase